MPDKTLDFFKNYSVTVKFELDKKEHIGLLIINPNSFLKLVIKAADCYLEFEENRIIDSPIVCQEIGTYNFFTLHDCMLQRGTIYTDFVVTGKDISHSFDRLEVCLTGVSTWLERLRANVITDFEFKRDIHVDKFSVDFDYKGHDYSIVNSRHVKSNSFKPSKYLIEIEDSFVIFKKNGLFSLKEAKDITQEIRNLFSLLLGQALSIRYSYLMSSDERQKYQSYIFLCVNYKEFPLEYFHQALCYFDNIIEWNLWDSIFKNFFKLESFRMIWDRLIPAFSDTASGFWEYNILSVVVTLEMYCAQESKGRGHKLNKIHYRQLKSALSSTLTKFIEENNFSDEDHQVLNGFIMCVENLRNTSHPTLQHKYNFIIENINPQVIDAIGFSESDFKIIKKLRDSVAHGLPYQTSILGDITEEIKIKDRLLTLLIYFVFRELGFSDHQIAKSLSYTHNSFVLNAGGNEKARDRLANNAKFITLSQNICLDRLNYYMPVVITYNKKYEQYFLDETLSYEVQNNWRESGISDVRKFVENKLPEDKKYNLNYFNKLYLRNGNEEKLYYGLVLLTII